MNKLQSTLIASVLTLSIAAPTFANDMPAPQFNQVEAQSLFETSAKPMELAALSQQEMKETEGAVIQFLPLIPPLAQGMILGAGASASIYTVGNLTRNQTGSISGALWSIGAGAIGGAHGGGLAMMAGLKGTQAVPLVVNGMAVSTSLNLANPSLANIPPSLPNLNNMSLNMLQQQLSAALRSSLTGRNY